MSKVYVQEKLTAGSNISIQDNVISSVGFAAQPTAPTNTDLIWIDTSDSQDDGFYPVQIDWVSDVGASTSNNPLGWRAGYWADNGSFQTSDEYIGTAVRVRAYSDSTSYTHFLYGVSKVIASLPEGVTVVVKEWNQSDTSVLTNTFNIEDGDFFSVDPNCMYSFAIHTSSENITEAYLNTIKMTMYRATQYREKTTEFERFSVRTNLNWSNISSTTTDNAETENMVIRKGFIALPTGYTALGKPTPVIMLSHGSGGSVTGTQINKNNADNLALIRAFTGAGYAVFDVDNTQANENGWADWGCLPLVSEYVLAWEHIRKTYNVRPEVNIYSMSMGTTAALNIMKWRFFPI